MQSTAKRIPFANSKPNSALYSRARHRYRRDATRVCAGLFDRPLWDWKGHHHNVLASLPNGSSTTDLNNMNHEVDDYESEATSTDVDVRVTERSSGGLGRQGDKSRSQTGMAKSGKQTPNQSQGKNKSSSAASMKGKSRSSLPASFKSDSRALNKEKGYGGRLSFSGRMSPRGDNRTPRSNSLSSQTAGSKRSISAVDGSFFTTSHHKKSRTARNGSSPGSTPPPNNHSSKHGKAYSVSSPSTTHSTALTPDPDDSRRAPDEGSDDEEAIVEHRSSRPRYRKGWKGWALVDSEPDTSRLIEIDRAPQVFQGRSTRSGKNFGVQEPEEWEDGYVDFGAKSKTFKWSIHTSQQN